MIKLIAFIIFVLIPAMFISVWGWTKFRDYWDKQNIIKQRFILSMSGIQFMLMILCSFAGCFASQNWSLSSVERNNWMSQIDSVQNLREKDYAEFQKKFAGHERELPQSAHGLIPEFPGRD